MADEKTKGDPELAERIAKAISFSGGVQRQIAIRVGVTPQSVTKWLRWGYMDKQHIPAFCRACGVSIEWFLTGEGDIEATNPIKDASDDQIIAAATERLSGESQTRLLAALASLIAQSQTPGQSDQ
jgi:transcriptional regulator with XRE-family HTH domain